MASAFRSASTAAASTARTVGGRVELTPEGVTVYNSWEDHGQGADLGALTHCARNAAPARPEAGADQAGDERHALPEQRPVGRQPFQRRYRQCRQGGCEMLINAMSKPNGTYRTYDEMVAEKIPLRYDGNGWPQTARRAAAETGQGKPVPDLHVRALHAGGRGRHATPARPRW